MTTKKESASPDFSSLTTEIGKRLKEERLRLGLKATDFDKFGGWPASTVYGWEAGKASPKSEFYASTQALGLDIPYIITGIRSLPAAPNAAEQNPSHRNLSGPAPAPACEDDVVLVSLMSATGSMGPGNELVTEDVVLGDVPLSRRWLSMNIPGVRTDALRLIHAYGDSMHGTLNSGDFAVVDTSCRTVEFPGVYLLHVNRLHFIKRVSFRMDGRLVVSSDNEAERTAEVLDGSHQLDVRGRVVYGWNGRRF